MDHEEIAIGAIGLATAYGIAEMFYKTAKSAYEPLIEAVSGYLEGKTVNFHTTYFSHELKVWSQDVSFDLSQVVKILKISENIAIASAFYVSFIETSLNFFRAWKGQGNRPFVVDIMEGGIRGSIVGLAVSFFKSEEDYRGVQIATGLVIGYTVGMMGAFIGSLGGYITHALLNSPIDTIDQKFREIGQSVFVK
ncbi:MAG TPA: hypothetical protein VLE96_03715 [Chlamydiales bacterium]|nr:hypothetical protein [Chlamydiales bacterium]